MVELFDKVKIAFLSKDNKWCFKIIDRSELQKHSWTYCIEMQQKVDVFQVYTTAVSHGHRCGYVGTPKWSKYYKPILEVDIDSHFNVHGGITYSSDELSFLVGDDRISNHFWMGFDCGHAGDARDSTIFDKTQKEFQDNYFSKTGLALLFEGNTVKTVEYVYRECLHLIVEIMDLYKAKTSRLQKLKDWRKSNNKEFKKYVEYLGLKDILKD